MHILRENFGNGCVDFGDGKNFFDDLSLASEKLTEAMLEKEVIEDDDIARAVVAREIFPCYFGTALETEGVEELLNGIGDYIDMPDRKEGFGARIFKIARDEKGQRLTFMKITGGQLAVRGKIGEQPKSYPHPPPEPHTRPACFWKLSAPAGSYPRSDMHVL